MTKPLEIDPINDHVAIKRHGAQEKKGRIWIAEAAQDPPLLGDVVAIGPNVKQVKVGNVVVFAMYTGVNANINDDNYLLMREEEILAIVK